LDGGDGVDRLTLTSDDVCNGGVRDEGLLSQSMEINNFEDIEIKEGRWMFEGDHREVDLLISGESCKFHCKSALNSGLKQID